MMRLLLFTTGLWRIQLLALMAGIIPLTLCGNAQAADGQTPVATLETPYVYKNIYLTENRVCKACRWEWTDEFHLRLTNRQGDRIVVPAKELVAIDHHPIWRKLIRGSQHGVGLPGFVIAPRTFERGEGFEPDKADPLYREMYKE